MASKDTILRKIQKQINLMGQSLRREKRIEKWWEKRLSFRQFIETEKLKHDYTIAFYDLIKQKPKIKQDYINMQKYIADSEFKRGRTVFELLTAQWNFADSMLEMIEKNIGIIRALENKEKENIRTQISINADQFKRFQQLRKLLYEEEFKYLATIFKLEKDINYKEIKLNKKELQREKIEILTFLRAVDLLKRLQIHLNYQFKYIDAIENYYISVVEHATKSEMKEMIGEERELEEVELGHKVRSLLPVVINIKSLIKLFAHNSNEEMRHVLTMEKMFKYQRMKNINLIWLTKKELSLEQLEKNYEGALKKVIKGKA